MTKVMYEQQESTARRQLDGKGNKDQYSPPQFDNWNTNKSTTPPVRGSRFFPNNRDVRLEDPNIPFDRPGSPSPPPPTMADHPAYDGDMAHPHVSLPRPSPIVKLPPPTVLAPIGPPKPASFAAAVIAPATIPSNAHYSSRNASSHQDVRRQDPIGGDWQHKINSLFGRNGSPPKSHTLAVDSSSKNALELPRPQFAATVSLPSTSVATGEDGSFITKPAAEECFEEQEMLGRWHLSRGQCQRNSRSCTPRARSLFLSIST